MTRRTPSDEQLARWEGMFLLLLMIVTIVIGIMGLDG